MKLLPCFIEQVSNSLRSRIVRMQSRGDPPSSVFLPGEDWASSPLFAALRLPRPGE